MGISYTGGPVTTANIADATIVTADLANGAITSGKIASGQIATAHIASGGITSGSIASGQVGHTTISSGGVTSGHIASGHVSTRHIASGSLFAIHLASGAIISGSIASGQIGGSQIASGGVTSGHLASGNVGTFHIASGNILAGHLASGAIISGSIASGQIGGAHLASGGITSGSIASGQIGQMHISSGGVLSGHIASGQLGTYHIAATAALERAKLAEDALAVYGIPIADVKAADGADLALTETAGDHFLSFTGNVWLLQGEEAISETEVSVSNFQFILPPEYVATGDVSVRVKHQGSGAGTAGTCTIDIQCREQSGNGTVGADLSTTTAATAVSKGAWATTDFVITAAGLVAGDILNIQIITSIQETGGAALAAQVDGIAVLCDIKG